MSNLFEKPIICDLKASPKITLSYLALFSCIEAAFIIGFYAQPLLLVLLSLGVGLIGVYYICHYGLRCLQGSVCALVLHNDQARLTYKNKSTSKQKIDTIILRGNWLVIEFSSRHRSIIIDQNTTDASSYSHIRRVSYQYFQP